MHDDFIAFGADYFFEEEVVGDAVVILLDDVGQQLEFVLA